jgi:septum site-determining protein MinC
MTLKSLNFTLLVVNLDNETLSELVDELHKKQLMAPDFFSQAPMVVNITHSSLDIDFLKLREVVEANGFLLTGITGNISAQQKQKANQCSVAVLHSSQRQAFNTELSEQQRHKKVNKVDPVIAEPTELALYENRTKVHIGRVRSGQQIYAKEADLVVSGDVGAGAEVIADGNIHIYGTLRGKALAGAMGNINAAIFCQTLQPELVSIAGVYKLSDTLPEGIWSKACSVFLEDQNMVFTRLNKI